MKRKHNAAGIVAPVVLAPTIIKLFHSEGSFLGLSLRFWGGFFLVFSAASLLLAVIGRGDK
jgi:hypothetical protein